MSNLIRFGISVEEELIESFDKLSEDRGYGNRSEALRDLMRDALVQSRVNAQPDKTEVIASLTLVYDHHARELSDRMASLQHEHYGLVISVLHIHVSHDDCMEVIAMQGKAGEVRRLADSLLSLKGVKNGRLFITLPGQHIAKGDTTPHHHPHSHAPVKKPARRRAK